MNLLFIGMTESGKTSLSREIAEVLRRQGMGVLVLDPLGAIGWTMADMTTRDPEEFNRWVADSQNCVCVCDEAGRYMGLHDTRYVHWAASGRHDGHVCMFIAQRTAMLNLTVRENADICFYFAAGASNAKAIEETFALRGELQNWRTLDRGEYLIIRKFPKKGQKRIDERRLF